MPATAGRVRMPANNRVHSSAALQTHGIWQSAIGYDPYAPNKDESKKTSNQKSAETEADVENAYASFQGLLALARITGSNADEARGACKKCGRVGHLTFQCKNFLSIKDDSKEKDPEAIQAAVLSGLDKLKGSAGKVNGKKVDESEEESEEEESESSDSDADSEIERILAERYGKKATSRKKSSKKKKEAVGEDGLESDSEKTKKRGRSEKRSSRKRGDSESEDEEEGRKRRRKEKRRKRSISSDEEGERHRRKRRSRKEKRRRRSHKYSDDSDSDATDGSSDREDERRHRKRKSRKDKRRRRSHRYSDASDTDASEDSGKKHSRKSRKAASFSDSEADNLDDSRVGRAEKRSEKRSRKYGHEKDD